MKFLIVLAVIGAVGWYYLKPLPPGKGPDAAKGMRVSNAVVQAIESYHSARNTYPVTLEDMVPEFLGGAPHMSNGSSIEYQRLGQTYKLTFNYANPLPVHCSYQPGKKWACEWF
jgi:hypothetical protein